ncbi:MAG: DUF951 domain-containing protein [Candidatus Caldatribacterium sp.]|uniref:DUF951 domain-containing protein n=1 Tax=Candidatus Caldatribacterium sp. TaxID=2282143 RepID=UPI00299A5F4E|nr:DUF951 domain-containing protein [Candidatus Caldatribacterium sp.]MCX7730448.1 DUF951 domain-containing protein [Candidatus Caldatribacterium sp.]MDW8080383.1 DUF951 domain-containing protein [Candidatus Calescibacterium sp.]
MGILYLEVDDVLTLKKTHPCGSQKWRVTRLGVDIGIKCLGCGRFVMIPRRKLEGKVQEICRQGRLLKPKECIIEV